MSLTKFTIENARHIVTMLLSDDVESIELALRILPGMDYKNYPHVYKFILDATLDNWWASPRIKPNPEATNVARALNWHHNEQQLRCLYPCEIDIVKALVSDHINRYTHDLLSGSDLSAIVKLNYE